MLLVEDLSTRNVKSNEANTDWACNFPRRDKKCSLHQGRTFIQSEGKYMTENLPQFEENHLLLMYM